MHMILLWRKSNCSFLNIEEATKLNYAYFWLVIRLACFLLDSSGGEGKGSLVSPHALWGSWWPLFGHFSLLLLFRGELLSLHWKMLIKLDLYVNVYIVQAFLLDAEFKTTLPFWWCVCWAKNWVITSCHFLSSVQFLLFFLWESFS